MTEQFNKWRAERHLTDHEAVLAKAAWDAGVRSCDPLGEKIRALIREELAELGGLAKWGTPDTCTHHWHIRAGKKYCAYCGISLFEANKRALEYELAFHRIHSQRNGAL